MTTGRVDDIRPDRLRTGHGAKWTAIAEAVLPAWVADMDLGIPPAVTTELQRTIDRQDLGYPYWADGDPVVAAFADRMQSKYGWTPQPDSTRVFSDLIQILQIVIEFTTQPGDTVALHVPNYPPFLAAIHRAGRRPAPLKFVDTPSGWVPDLDQHRALFDEENPRLLVVVNPHNPTGRALTRAELDVLAELARDNGIPVLADEIHSDLTYPSHSHIPFASLDSDVAALTITATSATKAFNLAGTRCAVAHIGHGPTKIALEKAPLDYFGTPSVLSRVATVAAWRHGDEWQQKILSILDGNRKRVAEWAATHPSLRQHEPEATYLSWLDFGETRLASDPAAHILERGRVQLSPGAEFAHHTSVDTRSFARLNFATTPNLLTEILSRIDDSMRG